MKKIIFAIVVAFCSTVLFAQSDEILDRLYETEDAKTLETALLVFQASNALTDQATIEDAESLLAETKWGQKVIEDGEYITVGGFSQLALEAFQLDHGVMYNILPFRRYALKEMLFQGYILGNPYPGDKMSSFNVIYAVSSMPVDEGINKNYVDTVDETPSNVVEVKETVEIEEVVEEPEVETEEVVEEPIAEEEVVEEPVAETEETTTNQEDLIEVDTNTEEAVE